MMSPEQLESFLHQEIPLTQALALGVAAFGPWHISLMAPLAPNRNDKGTGFAGSLGSLLTLAAWSLLQTKLADEGVDCELMIHKSEQEFLLPVTGDIMVYCELEEARWKLFLEALGRKGRARISMKSTLGGEAICARMVGSFVAVKK